MGCADLRTYSRNKRGIAGSLIWINFDRHALLNVFRKARGRFVAWKDEIRPQFRPDQDNFLDQTAIFSTGVARDAGLPGAGATIDNLDNIPIDAVSSLKELAAPWFSDQILPFDITFQFPNQVPSSCRPLSPGALGT